MSRLSLLSVALASLRWMRPGNSNCNKLSDVFDSMSSRVYTGYECRQTRVKGLVYDMLKKREEVFNDCLSDDEEEVQVVDEVSSLF